VAAAQRRQDSSRAHATVITLPGFLRARIRLWMRCRAVLGSPGDLQDVVGQAVVALGELGTDPGWAGVVPRRLDEDPPGVLGAGLGDRPVHVLLA